MCKNLPVLIFHFFFGLELYGEIAMKLSVLFSVFVYVLTPSLASMVNDRTSRSTRSLFADMPSFPLFNAAEPGLHLPALGLGTGFYARGTSLMARILNVAVSLMVILRVLNHRVVVLMHKKRCIRG